MEFISPEHSFSKVVSGALKSLSMQAAVSLASPVIDRQSDLFGVISKSTVLPYRPSASLMSSPKFTSSFIMNIPSLYFSGITFMLNPSSSNEQSMPSDTAPRILPLFIF